ncbi:hypothetical protein ACTMSW_26575 [Micromonospora sp. BQ11]|uniref:hypothetical protein n=1 Tax=Micromonospora sp. BQ11 TaxID=3452212 RepID=UPI003F8C3E36
MTGRVNVRRWLLAASAIVLLGAAPACGRAEEPIPPVSADREPAATGPADQVQDPASSAPADTPVPEACDLVTDREAAALARLKLDPKQPGPGACVWTAPTGGPTGQVEVYVGDGAKKTLDIERELGHELEPLPGVGDEAYLDLQANEVFARRADTWGMIRLVLLNDPKENREQLIDLIRVVVGRL